MVCHRSAFFKSIGRGGEFQLAFDFDFSGPLLPWEERPAKGAGNHCPTGRIPYVCSRNGVRLTTWPAEASTKNTSGLVTPTRVVR